MVLKNLSKTVDKILAIEPTLSDKLLPIKEKWEKSARKVYWKQLLTILNTEVPAQHPHRLEIKKLFLSKKSYKKHFYTFDPIGSNENIIGTIPENLECKFKKYDLIGINLAKKAMEAKMTKNKELMITINKAGENLDIKQRKLWIELKNYFNLWGISSTYLIRSKDSALVLTSIPADRGGGDTGSIEPIILGPEEFKKFLRLLPGFPSDSDQS
jgi:hypothetical protein